MTFLLPLQILIEPVGGGEPLDITKYTTGLSYGSVSPGGYGPASWTLNRELSELGSDYGQYSPVTVLNTETGGEEYEGLLDDPGRYAGPDGESFRMTASGVASTAQDINRPYVGIDSSLESWARGLTPFMREQVTDTTDRSAVVGAGILLTAQAGTVLPGGQGIAYVHYLPMIQSRQLIGSLLSKDVEYGQDSRFIVGHDFGMDSLDGVFAASHVSSTTPTTATFVAGTHFGDANTAALAWANAGATAQAGQDCWTRFGSIRVKPVIKNKSGTVVTGSPTTYTTWLEMVGDLLGGSGRLSLVDGASAVLQTGDDPATEIEHYIRPDGVTAAELLADLLLVEPWATWYVWGKTGSGYKFEWVKKPTEVAFDLDTEFEALDCPGSTAELWKSVQVRWRDEQSNILTLQQIRDASPILEAADVWREAIIDLGDNLYADPEEIATKFLLAHAHPKRSGTITITRPVYSLTDDEWYDPWQLPRRGQFRVRIAGTGGPGGSEPNGIDVFDVVECRFDADQVAAVCTLDSAERATWGPPPPTTYGKRKR